VLLKSIDKQKGKVGERQRDRGERGEREKRREGGERKES